mmetsp:Transcript_24092/g.39721  ORF Transcript_24092/g.39721 Transcript_24092/m.39721 type:complete len:261 (-) Transcript_24092:1803-2585(-)
MVDRTENRTVKTENADVSALALPALAGDFINLFSPTLESINCDMLAQVFLTSALTSALPFCVILNMAFTALSPPPVLPGVCVASLQLHTFDVELSSLWVHLIPSNTFDICADIASSDSSTRMRKVTSAMPSTRCCLFISDPHAPRCASTSAFSATVRTTLSFIIPAMCSSGLPDTAKFLATNLFPPASDIPFEFGDFVSSSACFLLSFCFFFFRRFFNRFFSAAGVFGFLIAASSSSIDIPSCCAECPFKALRTSSSSSA